MVSTDFIVDERPRNTQGENAALKAFIVNGGGGGYTVILQCECGYGLKS